MTDYTEEEKQERKRRVEAKMKSLMEERSGEELMSVEEISRRVQEIMKKSNYLKSTKGK